MRFTLKMLNEALLGRVDLPFFQAALTFEVIGVPAHGQQQSTLFFIRNNIWRLACLNAAWWTGTYCLRPNWYPVRRHVMEIGTVIFHRRLHG